METRLSCQIHVDLQLLLSYHVSKLQNVFYVIRSDSYLQWEINQTCTYVK